MKNQKTRKIRVVIRKRPISKKEIQCKEKDIVKSHDPEIIVAEDREKVDLTKFIEYHKYRFDRVFSENVTNNEVNLKDL
mgnify:CR=1 FL=1